MRLFSFIAGAVAFLSAATLAADVAYVVRTVIDARIEVRVDATGHTGYIYSRIEPTSPAQFHELAKRACPKNNCQRALNARPELASAFCATYTTTVNPGIGSTFTQCDSNAKLTRACACNYPPVATTTTPGQPSCLTDGARCTITAAPNCCGGCSIYTLGSGTCVPVTVTVE